MSVAATPDAVAANIETILRLEDAALQRRPLAGKVADRIGGFVGSVPFLVIHVIWFAVWAAINTGMLGIVGPFDPYPFQLLAMLLSMDGVLIAIFVLIAQNRMAELSDRRAHVDLQINLLTEREVTRLLQINELLAERLGVEHPVVAASELSRETKIEGLVSELDAKLNHAG